MNSTTARFLTLIPLLAAASPALAEVADKEPTVAEIWAWVAALNALSYRLGRLRPLFALLVLPVSLLWASSGLGEVNDPHVGPAILRELGASYVAQIYLASALMVAGPLIIMFLCRRRVRQSV